MSTTTAKCATEAAVSGWQAVTAALPDYACKAREIADDDGQSRVGAFQPVENAADRFVKTGSYHAGVTR